MRATGRHSAVARVDRWVVTPAIPGGGACGYALDVARRKETKAAKLAEDALDREERERLTGGLVRRVQPPLAGHWPPSNSLRASEGRWLN